MSSPKTHIVTGAFGYSGRHITRRLLEQGHRVKTLTGHPDRPDPFDGRVEVLPLAFDDPGALRAALAGADVLINTYWVRFDHGGNTHERAVAHTKALIDAAVDAGVGRVVHVSITQPSADSPLPYFRGKAELEAYLRASGLSYAILRPAVLFGGRDVLINNIAWILRRFPLFGVAGAGDYGIQPIHVEDLAVLACETAGTSGDVVLDAVGPESYRFEELVRLVAGAIGRHARIIHMPPWLLRWAAAVIGTAVGDVVLTRDEIDGLMQGLLVSDEAPTGTTRFSDWLEDHGGELGMNYAHEIDRHYRPDGAVKRVQQPLPG